LGFIARLTYGTAGFPEERSRNPGVWQMKVRARTRRPCAKKASFYVYVCRGPSVTDYYCLEIKKVLCVTGIWKFVTKASGLVLILDPQFHL